MSEIVIKEQKAAEGKERSSSEESAVPNFSVFWHPACDKHEVPHHPEQPDRVNYMMDALKLEFHDFEGDIFREAPRGKDEHIVLFHTQAHLDDFNKKCTRASAYYKKTKKVNYQPYDSDTAVMWATGEAAYRACGAMTASIDALFLDPTDPGAIDTAYCCTRPPGHHAERGKAQGFCFLNNAAIGAKYAQATYGESHGIRRVAVLDFDVHHGNGTEEGFMHDESCFYGSTHEKDNYPGTGKDKSPFVGEMAKSEVDRRIVNRYLNGGDGCLKNPNKSSRAEFRQKWPEIVSEMQRFRPDFVIFSSGFDAHSSDPLGNCWLEDEDFHWATTVVLEALTEMDKEEGRTVDATDRAKRCRKAVGVLEGGYDLEAISSSAVQHVRALLKLPCTSETPAEAAPLQIDIAGLTRRKEEKEKEKEKEEEEEEEEETDDENLTSFEKSERLERELAERTGSLIENVEGTDDALAAVIESLSLSMSPTPTQVVPHRAESTEKNEKEDLLAATSTAELSDENVLCP